MVVWKQAVRNSAEALEDAHTIDTSPLERSKMMAAQLEMQAMKADRDALLATMSLGEKGMLARIDTLEHELDDMRKSRNSADDECTRLSLALLDAENELAAASIGRRVLEVLLHALANGQLLPSASGTRYGKASAEARKEATKGGES